MFMCFLKLYTFYYFNETKENSIFKKKIDLKMSYSKNEIIDHNLKKLYNSNPQCLNVMDFELLDLNVFSHPKELV